MTRSLPGCSQPRGRSLEGRWRCDHTLGLAICSRAVLAQGLAQPGSGAFPGARASPHGAEQQPCHSTDTQPRPRMVPGHQLQFTAPRQLLTSWSVSPSGLMLHPLPPALQLPKFCQLSPSCGSQALSQGVKPTPSARGRGTRGLLAL